MLDRFNDGNMTYMSKYISHIHKHMYLFGLDLLIYEIASIYNKFHIIFTSHMTIYLIYENFMYVYQIEIICPRDK